MARNIRDTKIMTLLTGALCAGGALSYFAAPLSADEQPQYRVSDRAAATTTVAQDAAGQALIGPSGPIHSALYMPRNIAQAAGAKQLVPESAPAAGAGNAANLKLMALQAAEPKIEKPPTAVDAAKKPGAMVLQDLKTQPAPAAADKADSKSGPLKVLPIVPAPKDPKPAGTVLLSTENMIGPLAENSKLFSKLDIAESYSSKLTLPQDFRDYPSQPADNVRSSAVEPGLATEWFSQTFTWVAPAFHHKPLYFEQPNLERYGVGPYRITQPVLSAAHFYGSFILVAPYEMLTQHPCEKVYSLGHCRPGNAVPVQRLTLIGQSYPGEVRKYWENWSGYR